jgi:hypothetical protein
MPSSNQTSFDGIGSGLLPPSEKEELPNDLKIKKKTKSKGKGAADAKEPEKAKAEEAEREMMVEDFDPIQNDRIIFTKAKKTSKGSQRRNMSKNNDSYQSFLNQDISNSNTQTNDYQFLQKDIV